MKRKVSPLLAIVLFLASCAVLEPAAPGAKQTATPEATATPVGLGLVTVDDEAGTLRGRAVDPLTLADLPGKDAVDFGHHFTSALSPDGGTMAVMAWPAGSHSQGGALRLVDLSSWAVTETGVTVDGYASSLHFSQGGRFLYWAKADLRDTAHGIPRDYRLYRYWMDGTQATAVAELPAAFTPQEMGLAAGGRLAIYGIPTDANNLAQGPPRVLLVDVATGEMAAEIVLEGVTAGQYEVEAAAEGEAPYRMVQPALAWDGARSLLYVVHGDEEKVTVVDLEEGAVRRQAEVRPRASLPERIVGWGARTAEGKVLPAAEKEAALSPDGRRLYVTGVRREMRPDWIERGWPYDEAPLGVQVIDTERLTEVGRLDLPLTDVALSPDGRWLLAAGAYSVPAENGESERVAHGVYVVDAESMDVTAHLLAEQEVYLRGFSQDGDYAYVSTATSEWLDGRHTNWRTTLHVLDLDAGTVATGREFRGSFLDVVP